MSAEWDAVLKSNPSIAERWQARIRGDHSEVIPTAKADEEPAPVGFIHPPDDLVALASEIRKSQPGLTREMALLKALDISPEMGLRRGRVERAEETVREFRAAVAQRRLSKSKAPEVLREMSQRFADILLHRVTPVGKMEWDGEEIDAANHPRPWAVALVKQRDLYLADGATPDDVGRALALARVALGWEDPDEAVSRWDLPVDRADVQTAKTRGWVS